MAEIVSFESPDVSGLGCERCSECCVASVSLGEYLSYLVKFKL